MLEKKLNRSNTHTLETKTQTPLPVSLNPFNVPLLHTDNITSAFESKTNETQSTAELYNDDNSKNQTFFLTNKFYLIQIQMKAETHMPCYSFLTNVIFHIKISAHHTNTPVLLLTMEKQNVQNSKPVNWKQCQFYTAGLPQ